MFTYTYIYIYINKTHHEAFHIPVLQKCWTPKFNIFRSLTGNLVKGDVLISWAPIFWGVLNIILATYPLVNIHKTMENHHF